MIWISLDLESGVNGEEKLTIYSSVWSFVECSIRCGDSVNYASGKRVLNVIIPKYRLIMKKGYSWCANMLSD